MENTGHTRTISSGESSIFVSEFKGYPNLSISDQIGTHSIQVTGDAEFATETPDSLEIPAVNTVTVEECTSENTNLRDSFQLNTIA